MTRGQLARKADVNFETIRYYEKMKLMPEPERTESGYRIYTQEAVTRIQFIKRAQELGFSLKEISELLTLRVDPDTTSVAYLTVQSNILDRCDRISCCVCSPCQSLFCRQWNFGTPRKHPSTSY